MKDSTRARIWGWAFAALAIAAYLNESAPAYVAMIMITAVVIHASADILKALGK